MVITINCTHPGTGQPTSTSLEVEELDTDERSSIFSYLKRYGHGWRPYRLLEKAGGFARSHSNEDSSNGRWVTLLWSMSSGITREALELTSQNRALYTSRCFLEPGSIIWVGRLFNTHDDELYVEDEKDGSFSGTA